MKNIQVIMAALFPICFLEVLQWVEQQNTVFLTEGVVWSKIYFSKPYDGYNSLEVSYLHPRANLCPKYKL
jgi:hypothetical protein